MHVVLTPLAAGTGRSIGPGYLCAHGDRGTRGLSAPRTR
ncbi:hypothetical protein C791_1846 [Amycolatopsis azurea DSM 43854]|uniref:Uncharacterized protein n=1 Tax=Amycolatopsis azurea DSM 43854 TaxID=1238180 RepID=M2NZ87_9PSEU|nr:hypothetical protein C791_1846 [Amycolatopsis azurea DSM 43854]